MEKHTAKFEIESKNDAYAVEQLLNVLYDSLREESRSVRKGTSDSSEMLAQFEAMRDAARRQKPGRLTVVYETKNEPFETGP